MLKIAFTGHRPGKLPGGYNWDSKENQTLLNIIKKTVVLLTYKRQSFCVYTGGALGIDQMVASLINELKDEYDKEIYNKIAIPFDSNLHSSKWNIRTKRVYEDLLQDADDVIQVDLIKQYNPFNIQGYHKDKLQERNRYMVDNCDILIGIFDGSPSGTKNCIDYALKCGKMVIMINPKNYLIRRI